MEFLKPLPLPLPFNHLSQNLSPARTVSRSPNSFLKLIYVQSVLSADHFYLIFY